MQNALVSPPVDRPTRGWKYYSAGVPGRMTAVLYRELIYRRYARRKNIASLVKRKFPEVTRGIPLRGADDGDCNYGWDNFVSSRERR